MSNLNNKTNITFVTVAVQTAGVTEMTADAPGQNQQAGTWTLRLYVAGENQKSRTALANLTRLCELHIGEGRYEIEIIDLMKNPHLAKADQILALPTLIRKVPEPMKRVIGDLSNAERAMLALDLNEM